MYQDHGDGQAWWPAEDVGAEFQDYTLQHDEEDWQDDDLCCWDPRYKHGDYCHCAAYAKEQERQEKWGWILDPISRVRSIPFRVSTWWWQFKRKYVPQSVVCDNCDHKHWYVDSETKCPKCGYLNLPF